jgi:hypothetical protein
MNGLTYLAERDADDRLEASEERLGTTASYFVSGVLDFKVPGNIGASQV